MACRCHHPRLAGPPPISRREMLRQAGFGFGAWALLDLLTREGRLKAAPAAAPENPLAARPAHFPARAKHVIFLFMQGGPSHIDTFDPKPILDKLHGQPLPPRVTQGLQLQFTKMDAAILGSPQTFRKCGQSGLEIADTYPHLQTCADDLAIVRSCYHDSFNHAPAQYMLNTGSARMGHPCMGSWVTYGLGSESENLPGFVVMATTGDVKGGPPVYGHGFLPGTFEPTVLRNAGSPVLYLDPQGNHSGQGQRDVLDMVQWLNREHLAAHGHDVDDLSSRIASYELAFRMQSAVPDAVDLSQETQATKDLYGLDDRTAAKFGTDCLIARRLVERGVRFVQIFTGSGGADDWDAAHAENDKTHREMARRVDQPIAGLLKDLKARGLLDETLVIWGGEFGRTPVADGRYPDKRAGRDHNPYGFTTWLAGGGIKGGKVIGATDEFGLRAIEDRVHISDLHATILKLLGLDHRELTFLFQGREQRLTDVGGDHEFADRLLGRDST
ncbi:MAG TPA: DUF1501 domain-containing protein [Isosphaeraceae bacterium]|jgi:uncharacterized protein (DUF1501 family)|nr:DUF1501 domain-containing protein [Isosphaeraceae bacterium]